MSYLVSKTWCTKKTLPEVLFYKRRINKSLGLKKLEYVAFSTKRPKIWGELILDKLTTQYREDYTGPTLAIDLIKSKKTNQGLGTAMINFAKNYSKQNDCNGYLILRADASLSPQRVPQIFYRKQGFSTLDKKTDAKMDKFIKNGSNATIKDFVVNIMHYPPKQDKQRLSLLEKFQKMLEIFHF